MFANIVTDYKLNDLICLFGLFIRLKVINYNYKELRSESFSKAFLKTGNEFGIFVRDYGFWIALVV